MKIAITGAQGLLGGEFARTLAEKHAVVPFPPHSDLDLAEVGAVSAFLEIHRPDAVVHAAAVRDPDACEPDPDLAWKGNAIGTFSVVTAARRLGCVFMHASSDSVFPGDRDEPYHEFDLPGNPLTVYGRSKLAAETMVRDYLPRHFILRLPLLFGRTGGIAKNNLIKLFANARAGKKTTAMLDAFSTLCYCREAARAVLAMLASDSYGTYHIAHTGFVSRVGLLQAALQEAGFDPALVEGSTIAELKRPAKRPRHLGLRSLLLEPVFGITLPPWRESLRECVAELRQQGMV